MTKEYAERGLFLKVIHMTMDYAVSFSREEVIDYMVTNHDLWCQGAVEDATKTILDNNEKVGQNCFLSVNSHINCIVARCLINVFYLRHVPLSGHDDVAVFE